MALKLTVESFLQVVRQSGLIDKDQLQKLLQQYEARGVDVTKSQSIADALIGDEVVTRWQAEKLLAGKHKGFSLGKYKLLDLLGKGGMSSVYLAEHVLMRRRCAIKVLPSKRVNDSSYLARFHREAQAVASVDHPNIVRAYDVDCAQDRDSQIHFLVMEYVTGQSLQELIVRSGPAEYADAIEYVRQSAEGLEHAHRAGLVHRDIKPANILIDANGVIKILDMGLARFFNDADENPLTVAHDEKVLGTADYLAPEQALDSHTVDTRADIYSLGCSLYFFLTGHPPFTEGTLTQRLMWHQTKPFPPLTESRLDCPASLMALLDKMVAKNPDDRFPSAAAVATACRQWLDQNAGVEWQKSHVSLARSGSDLRKAATARDLKSDSDTVPKGESHVLESSVSPRDDADSSATKISRPGTAPAAQTPALPAIPATIAPPVAAPLAAPAPVPSPPVAAPMVAMPVAPVAPPIAQPVAAPPPPMARPVLPVAMPVAAPVAVTPVVPVAAPAATPIAAITTLTASPAAPAVETPDFLFGSGSASEETVMVAPDAATESDTAGDLFSLFAGGEEPPATEQPAEQPIAAEPLAKEPEAATPEFNFAEPVAFEPTEPSLPLAETVSFEPPVESQPETGTFDFDANETVATKPAPTKPTTVSSSSTAKAVKLNKTVLYAAIAAAAVVVIGGIAWWSTRGTSEDGKTVAKPNKKGKSLTNSGANKQTDAHEVTLHVGAGGEFKSIGRALHSAIEGKAEYETAAKGKPLRFLISVKPGAPFEESFELDEKFPGEVHLLSETSGKNITLKSPGDEPAISIKNLSGVTIENVTIDLTGFPPKDSGIVVSGSVARCRIKNSVISGAGKSGIELSGAVGGDGSEGISIESVTFQNAAPTAAGVHVAKPANGSPTQRATVQRCRFISSMSAAVFVEGPVDSLTIRNCGATGTVNGVRFAAGVIAKNVLVDHCSFRNQSEAGLLFDAMPGAGAGDFVWRNCLFAGVKTTELLIAKEYDANKFNALMSADKPSENNWSDRDPAKQVSGERDVLGKGGARVPAIQFASTSSNSELFLVAKPGEAYKSAGIKAK
ncbi:MAG: protein kinase [Planctomycetaceae bacterium]|nr:protein kinase [Planctomycetaceae bacterium]